MACEANRYLFHWMAPPQAARALERDILPASWLHFVPSAGRLISGVRLAAAFARDIGNAASRGGAVMVFDRDLLPTGGHDLDGRAAYDLTIRVMGARGAGDVDVLRRIVRATREAADRWSVAPDEHHLPFDVQPSRHGLIAVGLLQPRGPTAHFEAARAAAGRMKLPCVEAAVPVELASGIGRAVAERRRAIVAASALRNLPGPARAWLAREARPRTGDVYDAIAAPDFRAASPLGLLDADPCRDDSGIGRGLRLETVGDGFGGIGSVRIADRGISEASAQIKASGDRGGPG